MHVIDRRRRKKVGGPSAIEQVKSPGAVDITNPMENVSAASVGDVGVKQAEEQAEGDEYGWLHLQKGNRIDRIVGTPGEDMFGPYLVARVFGGVNE